MKRKSWILILWVVLFTTIPTQRSHAVVWVAIQAAVKKVIKAMDLAIQRLQNQTIKLQNAQKAIENAMAKLKLKEISEWSEKQRKIFQTYYDELWRVRAAITYYRRIREITNKQFQLVQEYKDAFKLFQQDKFFTPEQLLYIYDVYSGILEESVKNLDEIVLVINSFKTQMSDASRLEIINGASDRIEENLSHLRRFTDENIMMRIDKARDQQEILSLKAYYGISN
ncbi:conjugal transfer protein TraI [Chitinophaga defluvii]|uniref:Conjugal transfer protein TraI n=1 Tax=Chitinophaga defluvii TaxID=3163343 RepID=A0ABV2T8R3_9BACT